MLLAMNLHSAILCVLFLIVLRLSSGANALGNETDKLALMAFKSLIVQDPQRVLSSWNDSLHFCEWEGVTCGRRHQRVTILNIESKGLVGTISPHIGNLSFMRGFGLYNNSFHGGIPNQIGQLSRLKELSLTYNSLVGRIPVDISLCTSLEMLSLSYNNLVGEIPTELGSLTQLVKLYLGLNKLTGSIPPSLGNLTSLEVLSFPFNYLNGSVPSTLHRLKSLVRLHLTSNYLSGTFPSSLYNISTLEYFSISVNQLNGNLPTEIGYMLPVIGTIFIGENRFSGTIPASLFNASTISRIDLMRNGFTGKVPFSIGNPDGLQILALDENNLGGGREGDLDFFASLANCSNLQHLGIGQNNFGGMLPLSIANFSNQLTKLYLGGNQISGVIPINIEELRDLILLDMGNNLFTGSIPRGIGNHQNLQQLLLFGNKLSGEIPSSLRNMSRLFHLSLSGNILEGSIAPSLGNQNLQQLGLSYNKFTGAIPNREIALSVHLITFTLKHNSISGSIPQEVGNLKNLQIFDVSENNISGEIPFAFGGCASLEFLYLQGNFLRGPVPSSSSLPKGLLEFDLSRNRISGRIPRDLEKLSALRHLNLSLNNIEGEVPLEGIFLNTSSFEIFGNQDICGGVPMLELPKCPITTTKKNGNHLAVKLTLGILIPPFVVTLGTLVFVIYIKRRREAELTSEQNPEDLTEISYNDPRKDLMKVSYSDLYKATNGFSPDNLIGMGGYSSVYKGTLKEDEGLIAVKVLNIMEHGASKSFLAECEVLRNVLHRNLLKIVTVCSSSDFNSIEFKALVFEFMPNGSLESWLHSSTNNKFLSLNQRINIALDVASALDYLHNHCERPIVHCDLKPSNILLTEYMTAQVSDFGLARLISKNKPTSVSTFSMRGTIGYIPPEYGMGAKVSTRGDVYSYGILLLEMFTGKRPTDDIFKNGVSLRSFCETALSEEVMDIIDARLLSEGTSTTTLRNRTKELVTSVMRVGVACSAELPVERLHTKTALNEIQSIKDAFLQSEL